MQNEETESENFENQIKSQQKITKEIKKFYSNLFKRTSTKTSDACKMFLQNLNLPSLTQEQK